MRIELSIGWPKGQDSSRAFGEFGRLGPLPPVMDERSQVLLIEGTHARS